MAAGDLLQHEQYMRRCIELARRALETNDTPVGALIVRGGQLIASGVEAVRSRRDVTAHAEIEAIREAVQRVGSLDLTGSTLYTSVEPCVMCAYAIRLARVSTVVTGTGSTESDMALSGCTVLSDPRILPNRPPPVLVRDVLAEECLAVLMERKC
jgi:tRNA(adenine34) deaminase